MATISGIKANLLGGGARANQYRIELSFPTFVGLGVVAGQRAQFLCNSTSLPGSRINEIPVPYLGREFYVAGERTFDPWTISIYNDTTFGIRNALEQWSNGIQNLTTTEGITTPGDYQVDLSVHQLDRSGSIIKSYKFIDAWPIDISPIELSYEASNSIETFSTTFRYNYYTSVDSEGSGFGINTSISTPIGSFPL